MHEPMSSHLRIFWGNKDSFIIWERVTTPFFISVFYNAKIPFNIQVKRLYGIRNLNKMLIFPPLTSAGQEENSLFCLDAHNYFIFCYILLLEIKGINFYFINHNEYWFTTLLILYGLKLLFAGSRRVLAASGTLSAESSIVPVLRLWEGSLFHCWLW